MPSLRSLFLHSFRLCLIALALTAWLPLPLLAQEEAAAAEEGGGLLKTLIGYVLVLLGVGLGILAVVYPSKAGTPQPTPPKK